METLSYFNGNIAELNVASLPRYAYHQKAHLVPYPNVAERTVLNRIDEVHRAIDKTRFIGCYVTSLLFKRVITEQNNESFTIIPVLKQINVLSDIRKEMGTYDDDFWIPMNESSIMGATVSLDICTDDSTEPLLFSVLQGQKISHDTCNDVLNKIRNIHRTKKKLPYMMFTNRSFVYFPSINAGLTCEERVIADVKQYWDVDSIPLFEPSGRGFLYGIESGLFTYINGMSINSRFFELSQVKDSFYTVGGGVNGKILELFLHSETIESMKHNIIKELSYANI